MSNPLVEQGSLNRLRASMVVSSDATLNVTAPFLGREGISLGLDGETTAFLGTLTGVVTSPEPYQLVTVRVHLVRTQNLAAQYKKLMETNSLIGDITIRPDTKSIPPYIFLNCAVEGVDELKLNGSDPGFMVRIRGAYPINSSLYDA